MDDSCTLKKIEQINVEDYATLEIITKALSNKIRLAILDALLKHGELCACELEIAMGTPQPTITLNLHRLYYAGLLKRREESKYTYYSVKDTYLPLISCILRMNESQTKMVEKA